jgi:hypothetical protein
METENQILSTEQSLDIITRMIRQAHGNVKRNSIHLILWGLVITVANVGMFILMLMEYPRPYLIWLIALPAWMVSVWISYRHGKNATSRSHLDRINAFLWFGYSLIIFTIVVFGFKINYQLNPVILLVSAIPTFVSGTIIKFRPLAMGGILFWILGIVCFMVEGPWQYLIGAIAVTTGYLVPGILLRNNTTHV